MVRSAPLSILFVFLVAACAPGDTPDEEMAGTCVHGYLEPILMIEQVTSHPSGSDVARVALSAFKVNGEPRNAEEWSGPSSTWSNPSFNITVTEGVLYCDLPCGFGSEHGVYEFLADAPNHETRAVTVDARYASFDGGCPSYSDTGTKTSFELVEG